MTRTPDPRTGDGAPASLQWDQDTPFKAPACAVSGAWHLTVNTCVTVNTCEPLLKTWVILYLKILHIA